MSKTALRNRRKHELRKEKRNEKLNETLVAIDDYTVAYFGDDPHHLRIGGVVKSNPIKSSTLLVGSEIVTSPIYMINHLMVWTMSGSIYKLETPSANYLAYRERSGLGPISTHRFCFLGKDERHYVAKAHANGQGPRALAKIYGRWG